MLRTLLTVKAPANMFPVQTYRTQKEVEHTVYQGLVGRPWLRRNCEPLDPFHFYSNEDEEPTQHNMIFGDAWQVHRRLIKRKRNPER